MPLNRKIRLYHSLLAIFLISGSFFQNAQASQLRLKWGTVNKADSLRYANAVKRASANDRISSLLVWKSGETVVQAGFRGFSPNSKMNVKSVSKSILGILAGIAHDRKQLPDLDAPVYPLFNDYPVFTRDSLKRSITVRHLLTMSPGLLTTSHQYTNWTKSPDWIGFVLAQPLVFEPGRTMLYSSGNSHLLGAVIARSTRENLNSFAKKNLFEPLNIHLSGWDKDPDGYYFGGNNMALSPADLLKIGVLVLQKGEFEGKRIVSETWIDEMLSFQVRATLGERDAGYGYYWWQDRFNGKSVHFAWGFGGQYIFIIPEEQLVVVVTSVLKSTRTKTHNDMIYDLVQQDLMLPMVSSPSATQ